MLALYRSGRQADALEVYRETRAQLVSSFGIDPSASAARARARDPHAGRVARARRCAHRHQWRRPARRAVSRRGARCGALCRSRARRRARARLARIVADERELGDATAALGACGTPARTAAFTSDDPAADLVRLATTNDADLVLVDAPPGVDGAQLPGQLAALLERAPAHVAILAGGPVRLPGPVLRAVRRRRARLGRARARRVARVRDRIAVAARRHARGSAQRPSRRQPSARRCVARRPATGRGRHDTGARRTRPRRAPRSGGGRRRDRRRHLATLACATELAPPAARSSATRDRPSCSSTGACARAPSLRTRAAPASPGRSVSRAGRRRAPIDISATLATPSTTTAIALTRSGRIRPISRLADGPKVIAFWPTMPPPIGPRPGPPCGASMRSVAWKPACLSLTAPAAGVVDVAGLARSCRLLRGHLGGDDLLVGRAVLEQLLVRAATDDPAVLEHEDQVGVA